MEVAWCDHGTGRGWETPPPQRGARSAEAPRPADTSSAPATRWPKMDVEEKRESVPEEAMEEEEWALGQVVWKVGGQDGSWLFLFPLFRCGFLLFFLTGGWGPDYDRLGRSGARENGL